MKKSINLFSVVFLLIFSLCMLSCTQYNCSCFDVGGIASKISDNHDHILDIPASDFTNPVDGTYSIKGEADHDHEVSFTAEELEIVSNNNSKTVISTPGGTDGHTHEVTLDCGCE